MYFRGQDPRSKIHRRNLDNGAKGECGAHISPNAKLRDSSVKLLRAGESGQAMMLQCRECFGVK